MFKKTHHLCYWMKKYKYGFFWLMWLKFFEDEVVIHQCIKENCKIYVFGSIVMINSTSVINNEHIFQNSHIALFDQSFSRINLFLAYLEKYFILSFSVRIKYYKYTWLKCQFRHVFYFKTFPKQRWKVNI